MEREDRAFHDLQFGSEPKVEVASDGGAMTPWAKPSMTCCGARQIAENHVASFRYRPQILGFRA
jgi:hypothetical protein